MVQRIPVRWAVLGLAIVLLINLLLPPRLVQSRPMAQAIAQRTSYDQLHDGHAHLNAERYPEAIAILDATQRDFQQQGDDLGQIQALNLLALASQGWGDRAETDRAIAQSLALLALQDDALPLVQRLWAQALSIQGSVVFAQGQYAEALLTWEAAEVRYAQLNDWSKAAGTVINQAQALQALGFFVRSRQRLAQAEALLSETAEDSLRVIQLNSLASTLQFLGEYDEAQRVLETALEIATPASDPAMATVLINLGNTARAHSQREVAIAFYDRAVAVAPTSLVKAQALLNRLDIILEQDAAKPPEIAAVIESLCPLLASQPQGRSELYTHVHFAQSLLEAARHSSQIGTACGRSPSAEAAQRLGQVIQYARQTGDRAAEAYGLGYLGTVYEQQQQWSAAQQVTEEALLVVQSIAAPEIAYRWQWQLGRLLKQQGDVQGAIAAYQSAYEILQSIRSDLLATPSERQFSFRESVEPIYREYVDLLLGRSPTHPPLEQLLQARSVIESLQLAELSDFFRSACLEGREIALDALDQRDTAVLYPIVLRDRLELLLSLPNQPLRQYTVAVEQIALEQTLTDWRQFLEKPYSAPEGRTLGEQLYTWLISPLEADLETHSVQTIAFVLDGALRNVPMAALYDGDRYLVERYSVALAPGLQLLDPQPLRRQAMEVLAAGLSEARHGFSPLIHVPKELDYVQSAVSSDVLLNQDFTRDRLEQALTQQAFPIVHLATHGQFSSNAQETFVLAWDQPILVNELSELLRNRENAQVETLELLILSACETATGDRRAALGLAGVAVQAGARSTLASLWSLDDDSGAEFIRQFYGAIATASTSKAEALQHAQQAMLTLPNYRHPRYWAPYVLLGNWL